MTYILLCIRCPLERLNVPDIELPVITGFHDLPGLCCSICDYSYSIFFAFNYILS